MKVLVTGGAGYIGSHVVLMLAEAGHQTTVCDDLSSGVREAVLAGTLEIADVGDDDVERIFTHHSFDAVMHFAASVSVPESVRDPYGYYKNNAVATLRLLDCCRRHGIRHFVFSSTAAVYGMPSSLPVREDAAAQPINPYGASKLACEMMVADVSRAAGFNSVSLRYFNVAGADRQARIGQYSTEAKHLITVACRAAAGLLPKVELFGGDYDTADGTCVRDYIHVLDIADAHLRALDYLAHGGESQILNCGYGHGYSVAEVLGAVKTVTGADFPVTPSPRRAGDPAALIADNGRIRRVLGWTPRHDDLEAIIASAWRWQQKLIAEPRPAKPRPMAGAAHGASRDGGGSA